MLSLSYNVHELIYFYNMSLIKKSSLSLLFCLLFTGWLFYYYSTRYGGGPQSPVTQADRLKLKCLKQMQDKTCSIMSGPSENELPENAKNVLIAGYGELEVSAYKALRANPLNMCEHIYNACSSSEKDDLCRLGRVLYSE